MKSLLAKVRPPTAALATANFLMAAVLIYESWHGTQSAALLATPPRRLNLPETRIGLPARAANLASIQDHALFYASRQFYVPPAPGSIPITPPKPDYRLAGTFVIPSKPTVAVLTNQTGTRKVKPGDDLDGWRVQVVENRRVVLQYEDQILEITSAAQGNGSGMRAVPLTRTAQAASAGGTRTLGAAGGRAQLPTHDPSSAAPRLYRPPAPWHPPQ
jgi:hypothetical protein